MTDVRNLRDLGLRRRLARALQTRVAGPDAAARAHRIWATSGPRWFDSHDPVWRVHASPTMFVGGIRALVLQSLHPVAMHAVAEHSGYRDDPWARVASTSTYLAETVYGTVTHAEEAIERVRRVHRHVHGLTPDGRPYSADDPELLLWVHAAEIDSFLTAYQWFSGAPLSAQEADTYVAQAAVSATRLGVVDPPTDVASLRAVLEAYRPDLAMTPPARDAVALVLHEPPLAWWARPVYAVLAAAAVASLPGWARELLGARSRRWAAPAGRAVTAALGWVMGGRRERPDRTDRG